MAGVPGLTLCERWTFDPSSDSKAELFEEAVLAAINCKADVLLTSVKNDDMGTILELIKKYRFRHGKLRATNSVIIFNSKTLLLLPSFGPGSLSCRLWRECPLRTRGLRRPLKGLWLRCGSDANGEIAGERVQGWGAGQVQRPEPC